MCAATRAFTFVSIPLTHLRTLPPLIPCAFLLASISEHTIDKARACVLPWSLSESSSLCFLHPFHILIRAIYCPRSCAAWTAGHVLRLDGCIHTHAPVYTHLTPLRPLPSQRAVQQTRRQGQTDRQRRRGQRRQHRVLALSRGAYPHPIPPVTRPCTCTAQSA